MINLYKQNSIYLLLIASLLIYSGIVKTQGESKNEISLTPFRCFITEGYCQIEVEFSIKLTVKGEYCVYQQGFDEQIYCFQKAEDKRKLVILANENIRFYVQDMKNQSKLSEAEFYVMVYKSENQKKRRRRAWEIF
ncbi:MAG: DUF3019 domain-containing protein [Gammaproteobacteria bacterium]|nr:DUF3019 domain-containing protein [Gammaproteobacteria bacterium]